MTRLLSRVLALALCVAGLCAPVEAQAGTPHRAPTAPLTPLATPPECVTKSVFNPPSLPTWAFIVNFEVISGTAPLGCLAVYNASPPDTFYSIPCQTVGAITYFKGLGLYQGGQVRCTVNLQAYLTNPPISNTLETIMMQGVGRLSPYEASSSLYRSPIVYYTPTLGVTGTGLFLRGGSSGGNVSGFFRTQINGANFETSLTPHVFTTTLTNTLAQTWRSTYWRRKQPADTFLTLQNLINGTAWDTLNAGTPLPVSFRSDGGTFIVGGSPLGPNFLGTLDEIIVDPAGGSEPPEIAEVLPLTVTQVYMAVVGR